FEQRAMIVTEQPQIIGPAALHEAQIVGVIDDAGEIGVLVIDADLHLVTPMADRSIKMSSLQAMGPVSEASNGADTDRMATNFANARSKLPQRRSFRTAPAPAFQHLA